MACCAFAAFVISQLFLMGERLGAFFGISARPAQANPNAMWRLGGGVATARAAPPSRSFHLGVTALAICAGLTAGALLEIAGRSPGLEGLGLICTKNGVVRLAGAP